MPKISKTTKMQIKGKKVGSWSLPAGTSCPGSKDAEVCKTCYAKKGMYRFPVVKNVREYNRDDYRKDDWVDRMVAKVSKFDYFRWFDSGDIETHELAVKIWQVITQTSSVQHWLPTRSDKILDIHHILFGVEVGHDSKLSGVCSLPNVAIRLSADNIGLSKSERKGVNSYVIHPEDIFEAKKRAINLCPVTAPGSTQKSCDTCTLCYTDAEVAYVLH